MTDSNKQDSNQSESNLSDNEIILGYVKTIIKYIEDEDLDAIRDTDYMFYITTIKEKFNEFSVRYPALFNMIIENPKKFEYNRLIDMLNLKNSVDKNKTTYENASVKIGQEYYDEFVKKTVDKLNI